MHCSRHTLIGTLAASLLVTACGSELDEPNSVAVAFEKTASGETATGTCFRVCATRPDATARPDATDPANSASGGEVPPLATNERSCQTHLFTGGVAKGRSA